MQRKPTASEGAPAEPEDVGEGEEARIDDLSGAGASEAGSRLTPQQRAAARRELERLLDKLVADIKHRVPGPGALAVSCIAVLRTTRTQGFLRDDAAF